MIITKEMLDQKVDIHSFPTRLDSAINLYASVEEKGIVLYNVNPTTWNVLYPFYELEHKFTLDSYEFSSMDITYRELLEEYREVYQKNYEDEKGYSKEKRKEILISEYQKVFGLEYASIGAELESFYELKYSKSKKVWTLYYFENYVVGEVDNLDALLNQTIYPQEFLSLNNLSSSINGVEVVENTLYLLKNSENRRELETNQLFNS